MLAILVEDPGGVEACEEAFKDYEHRVPITSHTGPLVIEGTARSADKDPEWLETTSYSFFPVEQATITCGIPQSALGTVSSSLLLLNASVGCGYSVEKI